MIAVTGAVGFIGTNLARRLAAQGHELLLVDQPLTPSGAANLAGLPAFRFVDHESFLKLLQTERPRLDAIFHLGACSATTETDWQYLCRVNLDYTKTLWNWAAENRCPLLYASSAATYGDGSQGFDDRTPPEKLQPLNLYGKSKNDFDAWALAQIATGQTPPPVWAGLKFFNVYGPHEQHKGKMASVVWHAKRQIETDGEVRLFKSTVPGMADGEQLRDFVFVQDCIDHMLWLWQHPEASGIYNSGTGRARTFLDLAHAVFAALGREPNIRFIDMPETLAAQYQSYTQAEMSKLRQAGCTVPPTTLEDGVRQTLNWLTSDKLSADNAAA